MAGDLFAEGGSGVAELVTRRGKGVAAQQPGRGSSVAVIVMKNHRSWSKWVMSLGYVRSKTHRLGAANID